MDWFMAVAECGRLSSIDAYRLLLAARLVVSWQQAGHKPIMNRDNDAGRM